MDKHSEQKISLLPQNSIFQVGLVGVLVVASFLIGSLYTKVQYLEKGGSPTTAAPAAAPAAANEPQTAPDVPKVAKDDHIRGDKNAQLALVEYSDYECPFCKNFHPTAKRVIEEYKGKVMWVYRHYPLDFHANAQKEAEASECVAELGGEDAYWKFSDAVYERTTSNGTGFALDALAPLAKEIGVSDTKFKECLDSGKYTQKVKDQMAAGAKAGVTGTPGNIVLNVKTGATRLIPGAVPFEQVKAVIDEMLK